MVLIMKTNHKHAFAQTGGEQDVISKYWRKMYAYLKNYPPAVRRCKQAVNKRFRKYNRNILNFIDDSELIKH
jgi:DNA/RNA-binding domain of Phe-tRNA-synthetase-like protein